MSESKSHRQEYLYMLLDRLKTDCDYYLGNGNHHPQALWAGDEVEQISKMKEIWNQLDEKPEWLTMEQIQDYASKMGVDNTEIKKEENLSSQSDIANINVYQIKNPSECGYGFMPYDFAKNKLDINDYNLVASINIETNSKNPDIILEAAFAYGNMNKEYYTENPSARSISVSDILEYNGDKYYVDSLGFIKLDSNKLQEANINTIQNNQIDLEKEKEEVERQLKDVEELQTKKKELDDKIDELFESDSSREYCIDVENPEEVVDDKLKFFDIAFQLDKLSIFEVRYSKFKNNEKFPPDFATSGGKLEKNKRDWEYAGQCQDELLKKFPEAKKFYEKWDNKHLEYLRQDEYEDMLKDLEVLKNKYNYILKQPTDDSGISFAEKVWLSKEPLKKSNMTESLNKELILKEFDVLISLDDSISEESIDDVISNSILAVGGEVIDISGGKPQDWNETKFNVKANLPKDLAEHKLDEKIADSIFDLGGEVIDISVYRLLNLDETKEIESDKYLRKDIREYKNEEYTKLEETDFPSTAATKKELTPIELRQVNLNEYLTDEQKNYIIKNIDSLDNVQTYLEKLGNYYAEFRDDFQEEEIISIDEYISAYKNKFKKGNN